MSWQEVEEDGDEEVEEFDEDVMADIKAVEAVMADYEQDALFEREVANEVYNAEDAGDQDSLRMVHMKAEATFTELIERAGTMAESPPDCLHPMGGTSSTPLPPTAWPPHLLGFPLTPTLVAAGDDLNEEALVALEALAMDDSIPTVEVTDVQLNSSGKYDEEEEEGLTEDIKQSVAGLKLSKDELKTILPKVSWGRSRIRGCEEEEEEALDFGANLWAKNCSGGARWGAGGMDLPVN